MGITTALKGAGGFGKTTVARLVCTDTRVRERFGKHVYFVTLGREVRSRGAIAAKVAEVTRGITGDSVEVGADPEQLGVHLGNLLSRRPRSLLVIDDVWERAQLKPFLLGAEKRCVRLVTTRNPDVLPSDARAITVDRMSDVQARAVLTHGLDTPLPARQVDALLKATGRWALLLRIVNQSILALTSTGVDTRAASRQVLELLRVSGPAGVDAQTPLDLDDPEARNHAVRASIQAATKMLPSGGEARFAELGIFAEDEEIPLHLIAGLWRVTSGHDEIWSRMLCKRMADLSLFAMNASTSGGAIILHDVIRDYLRAELGPRLNQVNTSFIEAITGLPRTTSDSSSEWWQTDERYLQDHLIEHLVDAGREEEALATAGDFRWVRARLHQRGPTAPIRDLEGIDAERARLLATDLVRAAHLFSPTDPPHCLDAVLRSRFHALPNWNSQANSIRLHAPVLIDKWQPPDLPHPALLRTLVGHENPLTRLAISPDGTWLATGSADATVRIWDVASGEMLHALLGHESPVLAVAISPDGTWLATSAHQDAVRIWDSATGREIRVLTDREILVESVAISPDGTWLATGSRDGTVRIWDVASGEMLHALLGHEGSVGSVAISPDGTWLATSGHQDAVRIWETATGRQIRVLTDREISIGSVAISPDGTWLATSGHQDAVRIWETATGREIRRLPGTGHAWNLAIGPDGTWLAVARTDDIIAIWDVATGEEVRTYAGHTGIVLAVGISPDGKWMASCGHDFTARIWDMDSAGDWQPRGHGTPVWILAVSSNGDWLATCGYDRTVRIWESSSGREIHTLTGDLDYVATSQNGDLVATGSDSGLVRVWDVANGQELHALTGHDSAVTSVAISPDGSWLATASDDATVRIWDVASGQELHTLLGHDGEIHEMQISADGMWLAGACYDETVRLWDAMDGQELHIFVGHTANVMSVAISPDSSWLATGGHDATVRIWDVASGQELHTLLGHTDSVMSVAISPDGSWLVTGGHDATVRIWDVASGQELHTLLGHTGIVMSVAISPDGSWLASTGEDKTLRIWHMATARAVAMTRFDGGGLVCRWHPSRSEVFVSGDAGVYGYDFYSSDELAGP
ncbi:WD40 domain-containing protein [Streptomyces winkii]|uniref:WD40 domain-containing protein n=1 Tax=Streptomyces winkii TaxID=3051178 RepID=UPI0028D5CD90|nr:NB-ARC domain-containing protein [Streptomyces sp. DSM 40971]